MMFAIPCIHDDVNVLIEQVTINDSQIHQSRFEFELELIEPDNARDHRVAGHG